jgi:hypothetical protein
MHLPTSRAARAVAVAGVLGTVSMAGIGAASAATVSTKAAPSAATTVASPALQSSLQIIVWHPPYGCIVCGLGGFDPVFGDPINPVLPAAAGPVGF